MSNAAAPREIGDALSPVAREVPQRLDLTVGSVFDATDGPDELADRAAELVRLLHREVAHIVGHEPTIQSSCIVEGMELTKYTHATVVLTKNGTTLVIDPGAYTPNSAELVAATTAVLITHDHPDHFDVGILTAALEAQPDLRVWAPASVAAALEGHDGRVVSVKAGDSFDAAGFEVVVFGEQHAVIHADLPLMENVAYLVDGNVYHPGDSYFVPGVAVETLLVPTSGPWAKLGEGVDFVRAVTPTRSIQIHDLMLSDAGRGSFAEFMGNLTGVPLTTLETGTTITV